jgi:4-diphosphocytidyl-2-C-methyl-D-erythritol kinase
MICFPNAKINLGLNIVSKRPDGYHNLETVFCPVGLCDILEFVTEPGLPDGKYIFSSTGISLDGPEDNNLVVKAYRLLHDEFRLPALHIHLHKIIPPGAGLGGGSSDAAFMLKYLNLSFDLNLGTDDLCEYASKLGSDCAFFIRNKPLFGYEKGNLFREIPSFPEDYEVVLINPGIHISTASAYAAIHPRSPVCSTEEVIQLPVGQWKKLLINDFETAMIQTHPVIGRIIDQLYAEGADYASMSGSGSTVYGLFHKKAPAIKDQYPGFFYWSGPLGIL